MKKITVLSEEDLSRVIEMAWEDRTTFEAIEIQFGLDEPALMSLMQANLKPSSYRLWRKRVKTRSSKHAALRVFKASRAYAAMQYKLGR